MSAPDRTAQAARKKTPASPMRRCRKAERSSVTTPKMTTSAARRTSPTLSQVDSRFVAIPLAKLESFLWTGSSSQQWLCWFDCALRSSLRHYLGTYAINHDASQEQCASRLKKDCPAAHICREPDAHVRRSEANETDDQHR